MCICTVAPLPVLSDDGPQQAMVRQLCTGSVYGPKYSGCVSWMPYEISWNMWRCDDPVPPTTLMIVVAFGRGRVPPPMSNIIAAIVRGDLDGAVIRRALRLPVDRAGLIDVAGRLLGCSQPANETARQQATDERPRASCDWDMDSPEK